MAGGPETQVVKTLQHATDVGVTLSAAGHRAAVGIALDFSTVAIPKASVQADASLDKAGTWRLPPSLSI